MKEAYQFENLEAWKKAKELTVLVYQLAAKFPNYERYDFCSQIRRAVISVPSNIAEGSGRISYKEKIHFLEIAYGSLMETYCQLLIAVDLNYLTNEDLEQIKPSIFDTSRLLSGLRRSYEAKL